MAYIRRTSTYRKTAPKRKTYSKPAFKKRPVYRKKTTLTRQVKMLTQSVESKVCGIKDVARPCLNTHTGSKTNMCLLGTQPSTYDGFIGLNSIDFPQDQTRNGRNGAKMYLKNMFFKMNIVAKHFDAGALASADVDKMASYSDLKFRVVFFKFRNRRSSISYNPTIDFWIDEKGNNVGLRTTSIQGDDQMFYLVNSKRYQVLHQQYFCLSPPIQTVYNINTTNKTYSSIVQGKHPSERNIFKKFTFNKPIYFENTNTDHPTGDNNIYCAIIATSADKVAESDNWIVTTYITTTASDV